MATCFIVHSTYRLTLTIVVGELIASAGDGMWISFAIRAGVPVYRVFRKGAKDDQIDRSALVPECLRLLSLYVP